MQWFRSWPAGDIPDDRHHVVDSIPRLLMTDYDYARVSPGSIPPGQGWAWNTIGGHVHWPNVRPGLCLLEWDVALDPEARCRFLGEALLEPRRVLAAPYLMGDGHACRVGDVPVDLGVTECETFGFGCTYLPYPAVVAFLETGMVNGFTDSTFSRWYLEHHGRARVTWAVSPQHLHRYSEWE